MSLEDEVIIEVPKHWSEPFKVKGVPNLYLELTDFELGAEVPEGIQDSIKVIPALYDAEDGTEVSPESERQKTAREFALHCYPCNDYETTGKSMLLCASMPFETYRFKSFNEQDADDWLYFAGAVWGKTEADFVTRTEARARIEPIVIEDNQSE